MQPIRSDVNFQIAPNTKSFYCHNIPVQPNRDCNIALDVPTLGFDEGRTIIDGKYLERIEKSVGCYKLDSSDIYLEQNWSG